MSVKIFPNQHSEYVPRDIAMHCLRGEVCWMVGRAFVLDDGGMEKVSHASVEITRPHSFRTILDTCPTDMSHLSPPERIKNCLLFSCLYFRHPLTLVQLTCVPLRAVQVPVPESALIDARLSMENGTGIGRGGDVKTFHPSLCS
ncbi:hypothetical protein JTE90_013591 [Oedothorax gibbosus]|uniref:Uncharacterized protein n=1 Tax=Oedothorax gibbosus TaxID=931172 RepID=A0AAV6VHI0_9ARAC|nr:hypothetical protein JTE90_013591 [Oedothorax gibbosus]